MEENKYAPLTEEHFKEVKSIVDSITSHMPEDKADIIWNTYNAIRNATERQPCTCGSSGRMWGEAIAAIRQFINSRL